MHTFVLVHGAFADQSAWGAVKPLLEAAGHKVVTFDLPAHGKDNTPPENISLGDYIDVVATVVNAQPGKVILVGHSMAGMVISGVAEIAAEKIERLIYVAAYLPQSGQCLQQLAGTDTESLVGQNMQFASDYSTVLIKKEMVAQAICADLPLQLQELIVNSQKPEPLKPFNDALTLTEGNFGRIPKSYIETTEDRAVTNTLQKQMINTNGQVKHVLSISTSHLPFLAQPERFVELLLSIN